MSWLAEILRKQHRVCARCGMGPTHVYRGTVPGETPAPPEEGEPRPEAGTPLCDACLRERLEADLSGFSGRCLLFEPCLGPDALLWRPLGGGPDPDGLWTGDQAETARGKLDRMAARCEACGQAARFVWIPVENDANLWAGDWLDALAGGGLAPTGALCGRCAAARLCDSIESRGLCFEGIVPPPAADPGARGVLFCAEVEEPETDAR